MNQDSNPNNCETCDHKRNPDDGHCYMFRDEPNDVCMQHTGHQAIGISPALARLFVSALVKRRARKPVTCLSCGSKAETAETIPCGH